MKTRYFFVVIMIAALMASLTACSSGPSEANADSSDSENSGGFFDRLKPAPKVTIPAGTRLRVILNDGVSTNKSSPGDEFTASLAEPVIIDGKMVLAKGTAVRGRVVDVNESGRVKGRASIQLRLTAIERDKGGDVPIATKTYSAVAEATKKRDAAIIAGGAGIGAAIGALTGGGKGAATGAAIGGGAGTGTVLATKGKEIHYPPETRLTFSLAEPVEIEM